MESIKMSGTRNCGYYKLQTLIMKYWVRVNYSMKNELYNKSGGEINIAQYNWIKLFKVYPWTRHDDACCTCIHHCKRTISHTIAGEKTTTGQLKWNFLWYLSLTYNSLLTTGYDSWERKRRKINNMMKKRIRSNKKTGSSWSPVHPRE